MVSAFNGTSLIGTRSRLFSGEVVRCVAGSKVRTVSNVLPKKSSRTGAASPGAHRSRMPPRTAYSPVSRTVAVRRKPLPSNHATRSSIATDWPGFACSAASRISSAGGTRWMMAFAVVSTTHGPLRPAATSLSAETRRAATSAEGETRS